MRGDQSGMDGVEFPPVSSTAGAFVGLEGLVSAVARDRVIVLMNLLGKDQTLKFDATDLSAA